MHLRLLLTVTLALAVSTTTRAEKTEAGDPATRSLMHSVLAPLAKALEVSFTEGAFDDPRNHQAVLATLATLRDNAGLFDAHARGQDLAFSYVTKSLQRDARSLYRFYARGDYEEARFTLHSMTENCIACHSTLPETRSAPPASAFFAAIKVDRLPVLERAQILVMTRQFDAALQVYEDFLGSVDIPVANVLTLGAFVDYLKLCANVKGDLKRPQATLAALMAKPGVPAIVRAQLGRWQASLRLLDGGRVLAATDLATARHLLSEGRARAGYFGDRDALMHELAAATILNRYIHAHANRGADAAEAYYLLGTTETQLGRTAWVQRQEYYFETAIRLAPTAAFAPKAYNALEATYSTGLGGTRYIPADAKALLAELRGLIDAPKKAGR